MTMTGDGHRWTVQCEPEAASHQWSWETETEE